MKNRIISVGIMILGMHSLYGSIDSDRIEQKLSQATSKAFGNFMMFKDRINPQGLEEWDASINEGKRLVLLANKKNKKVNDYLNRINVANNELINTIKLAYNTMFLPFLTVDTVPYQDRINNINYQHKFTGIFLKIKNDMNELQQKVKKSKISEGDIVVSLAAYISNYADNAINSMEYWLSVPTSKFYSDIEEYAAQPQGTSTRPSRTRTWKVVREKF